MITLSRGNLSFTFPEVAQQVRLLVEQKIQEIASELPPTWDRAALWATIESSRYFHQLSLQARKNAHYVVHTWTPSHVEGALRKAVIERGGLNTDAFTELTIRFQRTTRIPEDGKTYALPMQFGQIPLRSVDEFSDSAPLPWIAAGGVIMPLARSEALSIWFSSRYRFAVKIGVGRANQLTGEQWSCDLRREPQDYVVVPDAPSGANDEVVRRYVALPLSSDLPLDARSAGDANGNRIILQVVPISAAQYYRDEGAFFLRDVKEFFMRLIFAPTICGELAGSERRSEEWEARHPEDEESPNQTAAHQEVVADPNALSVWDQSQSIRCCVHTCGELLWRQLTGANQPYPSLATEDYREAGIPWIDEYCGYRTGSKTILPSIGDSLSRSSASRRPLAIREFAQVL